MSRGLGKLQRALLVALSEGEAWTTALDLAARVEGNSVAVRRALHGLRRRGLVRLAHQGLRAYGAEVLCAWLPTQKAPRDYPSGELGLNPKRCVPAKNPTTQHLPEGGAL